MQPQIFEDKIFYYEGVLKNAAEIIELIEKTDPGLLDTDAIKPWIKWTASDNEDYIFGYQKQIDASKLETSSEDVKFIFTTLWDLLVKVGEDYMNTLGLDIVPPSPLSISKYIEGAGMGPHVDDYNQRGITPVMSGVLYLNDDVEGGELFFTEQKIKIKPKAGSIVVFPSVEPFYHQSLPVIKGQKYMSPVFWVKRTE